jgi:hypothetical protein
MSFLVTTCSECPFFHTSIDLDSGYEMAYQTSYNCKSDENAKDLINKDVLIHTPEETVAENCPLKENPITVLYYQE